VGLEGEFLVEADRVQNPTSVVQIDRRLCVQAQPMLPREQWLKANVQLLTNDPSVTPERWLGSLLEVLEGKFPTGNDPSAPFGYTTQPETGRPPRRVRRQRRRREE
jgi:hypothetical protein